MKQQKYNKHFFLLLTLILASILQGNSQTSVYHKFPTNNVIWREFSGGYQSSNCKDYQYTIIGDTIIGSYTYHKIQNTGVRYTEDMSGNCTSTILAYFGYYAGAMREDTISKRVFYIAPNNSSDTLLYDFNLNIGDSLSSNLNYDRSRAQFTNYVSTIDSIFIDNNYRKRFGISGHGQPTNDSNYVYVYLIEGIGSTFGLFGYLQPPFERGSNLLCFMQNGITVFPDKGTACSPVSVLENEFDKSIYELYPSPVTDLSIIQLNAFMSFVYLDIFNQLGEKIQSINVYNQNNIIISRKDFIPGYYIFKLVDKENKKYMGKFIVR